MNLTPKRLMIILLVIAGAIAGYIPYLLTRPKPENLTSINYEVTNISIDAHFFNITINWVKLPSDGVDFYQYKLANSVKQFTDTTFYTGDSFTLSIQGNHTGTAPSNMTLTLYSHKYGAIALGLGNNETQIPQPA